MANQLIADGTVPLNWYDPSTAPTVGPAVWFGPVPYGSGSLWVGDTPGYPYPNAVFGQSGWRTIGYTQTFSGNLCYGIPSYGTGMFPTLTNMNLKLTTPGNVSQKTLVACAIFADITNALSSGDEPSDSYPIFKTYTWNGGVVSLPVISAHLEGGGKPAGANEAMLDGHVEWRPFQKMIHRNLLSPVYCYY
jgi:hypothetical protein